MISLIGSLAGLTLGGGLMAVVSALLGWPVSLPAGSFGVLILVAVGIGCVFGVYPAVKASLSAPGRGPAPGSDNIFRLFFFAKVWYTKISVYRRNPQ